MCLWINGSIFSKVNIASKSRTRASYWALRPFFFYYFRLCNSSILERSSMLQGWFSDITTEGCSLEFRGKYTHVLISNKDAVSNVIYNFNHQTFLLSIISDIHFILLQHCHCFLALTRSWNCPWLGSKWGVDLIINIYSVLISSIWIMFLWKILSISIMYISLTQVLVLKSV